MLSAASVLENVKFLEEMYEKKRGEMRAYITEGAREDMKAKAEK